MILQLWLVKFNVLIIILNWYLVQKLNNENSVHLTNTMRSAYGGKKPEVCEEEIIDRFSKRYLEKFRQKNNRGYFLRDSADLFCYHRYYDD